MKNLTCLYTATILISLIILISSGCEKSPDTQLPSLEFEPNDHAKDSILLNVNMRANNQLFHVEPILRTDGKKGFVGLVALAGNPNSRPAKDGKGYVVESIDFKLINDPANITQTNLFLDTSEIIKGVGLAMDTLVIIANQGDGLTGLYHTLIFDNPVDSGYRADIKFIIKNSATTGDDYNKIRPLTPPRICTWEFY